MERRIAALLSRPGLDPEARAELLAIAATYLRSGEPMPEALRIHLADAFDATAKAGRSQRPKTLAEALGLVGEANRPSKLGPVEVVKATVQSEDRLARRLMDDYGVSERTARKRIAEGKKANENLRKIMESNKLTGVVVRKGRDRKLPE